MSHLNKIDIDLVQVGLKPTQGSLKPTQVGLKTFIFLINERS